MWLPISIYYINTFHTLPNLHPDFLRPVSYRSAATPVGDVEIEFSYLKLKKNFFGLSLNLCYFAHMELHFYATSALNVSNL